MVRCWKAQGGTFEAPKVKEPCPRTEWLRAFRSALQTEILMLARQVAAILSFDIAVAIRDPLAIAGVCLQPRPSHCDRHCTDWTTLEQKSEPR